MSTTRPAQASLAALAVGLVLGLNACSGGHDEGGMDGMHHGSSTSAGPAAPASSGDPGAGGSAAATFNDADVAFVHAMLPHHQQAVDLSGTLLTKSGVSQGTTALARQIKEAQQPEIETMRGWLEAWGQSTEGGMVGMDDGMADGMASEAELEKFDQTQGTDAEKTFLELMTKHHQGAVAMAETEIKKGQNPDAVALAGSIRSSQQAEIVAMEQLLAQL